MRKLNVLIAGSTGFIGIQLIKILIKSDELKKMSKIDSNKKIYKILENEIKNSIHSLQILID